MNPLKNSWKVVGAGTALAALGIAGLGFSGVSNDVNLPDGINLRDRVPVSEAAEEATPGFRIVPAPLAEDSLDSPFDSVAAGTLNSVDTASFDSPAGASINSPDSASFDSPQNFGPPASNPAPQPGFDVASTSFDSPASASFDSPDTYVAPSAPAPQAGFDSYSASFDSPETYVAPSFNPAPQAGFDNASASFDSPDSVSFDSASFSS